MTSLKGIAGIRGAHHVTGVLGCPNNAETERQTIKGPESFPPNGTCHHEKGKHPELRNKMQKLPKRRRLFLFWFLCMMPCKKEILQILVTIKWVATLKSCHF